MVYIRNDINKDGKYNFVKLSCYTNDIMREINSIISTLKKAKLDIIKYEGCSNEKI